MKRLLLAVALLLFIGAPAFAACKKPVGTYVGAGTGLFYDGTTGEIVEGVSEAMTVAIASNGSATITENGKRLSESGGRVNETSVVTAANNVFSTVTCQGTVTLSTGDVYVYTSSNSGAEVNFSYYTNDDILGIIIITLKKV